LGRLLFYIHGDLQYLDSKLYKGTRGAQLIKEIEKMEDTRISALPMINLDTVACQACRENNKESLKEYTREPAQGGNKDRYATLMGGLNKTSDIEEFTYF
jgi:hypothetical protein